MVVVRHLVEDRTFAIVEAQPQGPVLPLQFGAVDREGRALGLGDVQRFEVGAHLGAPEPRDVLGVHLGLAVVVVLLDLEQLEGVHVDEQFQAGDRMAVGVAIGGFAGPEVAPAEAAVLVLLGHQGFAVSPDIDEDQVMSVNPRSARAAMTSGCSRIASSTSWNSSTVKFGVTPGMCSNDRTVPSVRSTVAS